MSTIDTISQYGKQDEKSEILTFTVTSDSWINNGLVKLALELERNFSERVEINIDPETVQITAYNKEEVKNAICGALKNIAKRDTYYFSSIFKMLNIDLGADYGKPLPYPETKKDLESEISITNDEKKHLKQNRKIANPKRKQKVWKQRISFLSVNPKNNYINIGLNLSDYQTELVNNVLETEGNNTCPVCGLVSKKLYEIKQQFNPIASEHHNNKLEGIGDKRYNPKACPKCVLLSYFSWFNGKIPFYQVPAKDTYFAIPNTQNLEILKKIHKNLSTDNQFVDFEDGTCTSYSSNIQFLPYRSKNASLLALLHNIKNKYSKDEEGLFMGFESPTKEEFSYMTEWLFISKSFRIVHIKANEKIYDILEMFEDPTNGEETYLVPSFLDNVFYNNFDEYFTETFFEGILKLDSRKISTGLFHMAKTSVENPITQRFRRSGNSPWFLFENLFLPKIMEVSVLLDENMSEACKDIAKNIGRGFSKDVGMLTKFAYASGPDEFKNALEEAIFRLAKKSAMNETGVNFVSEKNIDIVLKKINNDTFKDFRNYFVSFMSVAVLSENYRQQKK